MGGAGGAVDRDHALGLVAVPARRGLGIGQGHDLGTQRAHHVLDISAQAGRLAARKLAGARLDNGHTMGSCRDCARNQSRCQNDPKQSDAKETHVRTIARFGNNVKGLLGFVVGTPRPAP